MPHVQRNKQKKKIDRIKQIPLILLFLFIIAFRIEIFGFLEVLLKISIGILKSFLGLPVGNIPFEKLGYFNILAFNLFLGFGAVFFFWLGVISFHSLLPVNGFRDIYRTAYHLLISILKKHGQAVFIRDGKKLATKDELKKQGSGVVVVDFNSAVVLEERVPDARFLKKLWQDILIGLKLIDPYTPLRAEGPGLVFTRPGERIRDAVDLREQARVKKGVQAYTRDGIEVKTTVFAVFTIGQEPDVLQVSFEGDQFNKQSLRVINFEKQSEDQIKISSMSDELDDADRIEIYHFARAASRINKANGKGKADNLLQPFFLLPRSEELPAFDSERVTAAVLSQARDKDGNLIPWYELPVMVAVDVFREILSHVFYDDLYTLDQELFPLPDFKKKLRIALRNQGVLSYRLIYHKSGKALEKGGIYSINDLLTTDVYPLKSSKFLRDRKIKVISSGFGDLIPVSDAVYQQRLDTWRAKWDKETELARANGELHASRVRSRAHSRAQKDLSDTLRQIFSNESYTQEVMALQVLKVLEKTAQNPETRQLLPLETIRLLSNLENLLNISDDRQEPPVEGGWFL